MWDAWPTPSWAAWAHVAIFGAAEAGLQLLLPGKIHKGPITPKGNVPVYKVTGLWLTDRPFALACPHASPDTHEVVLERLPQSEMLQICHAPCKLKSDRH